MGRMMERDMEIIMAHPFRMNGVQFQILYWCILVKHSCLQPGSFT